MATYSSAKVCELVEILNAYLSEQEYFNNNIELSLKCGFKGSMWGENEVFKQHNLDIPV